MDDQTKRVVAAAIGVLATVAPHTLTRNRNRGGRTGVDSLALQKLALAVEEVFPEAMKIARERATCPACGRKPWQAYHDNDCPHREHDVYD